MQPWEILDTADEIVTAADAAAAVARISREVSAQLRDTLPLVVGVMGGGVIFTGQLLPQLRFPLEFDYVHVTRYGDKLRGGELAWRVLPQARIADRTVLILDDILDEGYTLAAVRDKMLELGAARVLTAVFCEKDLGRPKPIVADFVGVTLPDRYVFGYGMDVSGLWRNLPAIYAIAESR